MTLWLSILIPSAVVGILCELFIKHKTLGLILAGAIPWFGLLGWQLYMEYFSPYKGGGASMWIVGQLFAGTIAALIGIGCYFLTKIIRAND